MRVFFHALSALFFLFASPLAAGAASEDSLPDAILDPGRDPGHILVVDKAEQVLYLYRHENRKVSLSRVMSCSTGENRGDKLVEGDKKTPNGYYIFNQKLLPNELSPIYGTLAYPTDYPNFWDKTQARGGYGIWLHGINKPMIDYDSNGCIELENADIAQLEELINLYDTPILTYESLEVKPAEELAAEGAAVRNFVENWRLAWENKDLAAYRDMYDQAFANTDGRNFESWMANKARLAEIYKNIYVAFENIKVFRHRDVIVAVFDQNYRGDSRFTSIGRKRLYLKNVGNGYKIVGEEFSPIPNGKTHKWLTAEQKRLAIETPPLTVAQLKPEDLAQEPEESRAAAEAKAANDEAEDQAEAEAEAAAEAAKIAEAEAEAEAKALAEAEAKRIAEEEAEAGALAASRELALTEAVKWLESLDSDEEIIALVQDWALAWQNRDVEKYFAFYHPDFYYEDKNMFLKNFENYRAPLIRKAAVLEVAVSDFKISRNGPAIAVSFRQDYRSDDWRDRGLKTLTLKKDRSRWKIAGETWKALP